MKLPHGFTLEARDPLPEFKAEGLHIRHEKTGMEIYHVVCDDVDNLFAFTLKTLPEDSSGVAHILEHSVLCGSKRFPVKDPFALLLKGSMNTFLNALTFPDKTVYPASSTVPRDLFNLLDVYADAVYFPLLSEEMFMQEGHRLEHDNDGKLMRTGVVYNEMKGNYSTHDSVAGDWSIRSLFPNTSYGNDSGGDPDCIPDLNYQAFLDFHKKHYHPSNTRLFLYGNIATKDYLDFIQDRILKHFDTNLAPRQSELNPKTFEKAQELSVFYPADAGDEDGETASVSVNYLLGSVCDPLNTLSWEVLTEVLLGSPASPLQRALVDSGLGDDLASTSGLETELARLVFSAGLRGTDPERREAIVAIIDTCLADIVKNGFDADLVEGTLRRFEFRAREIKGGPFGLRLMRRAMRGWLHGSPPAQTMRFSQHMDDLRVRLSQDSRYFEKLIDTMLVKNPHKSILSVAPDANKNQREEKEQRLKLDAIDAKMSEKDKNILKQKLAKLKTWQETQDSPEAIASIPFLGRADIPLKVSSIPSHFDNIKTKTGLLACMVHPVYANGISYIDLVFDVSHLQAEEQALLPLFLGMTTSLGIPGTNYQEMATKLALSTGGFSAICETSMTMNPAAPQSSKVFWRLKTLDRTMKEAWALALSLILNADYSDTRRLADLFAENRNEARSAIIPSGNAYASLRADRRFSPAEALEELWRGLSQIILLEDLEKTLGDKTAEFLAKAFESLRKRLLVRNGFLCNISANEETVPLARQLITEISDKLSTESSKPEIKELLQDYAGSTGLLWCQSCENVLQAPRADEIIEANTLASKVAFTALSLPGPALGTQEYAALGILCHHLRTGPLWEKVRMKGGAYGANASVDGLSKILSFSSYRDPNITKTFLAFKESLEECIQDGIDEQTLLLATLGLVSRDLRPFSPAEAGFIGLRRHLYGTSDQIRQKSRDFTLALGTKDLVDAAKNVLKNWSSAQRALVAGAEMVDKEENTPGAGKFERRDISTGA